MIRGKEMKNIYSNKELTGLHFFYPDFYVFAHHFSPAPDLHSYE
ncbi:hypothetical protein MuYL_4246 [Mucilaginibacter xinganensis]|uniref:Uncharacterized protein n=1 Tax=Mucilaginibacter xinganensis TaxID=1234841 RepID=A0A223P2T4_9SPHI|nr:hypothetical protein MuYL_4246 [Mucilaginibacter xinganensis]